MKAFIESQFKYCPLLWMFHRREMNNRINGFHERVLRLVYKGSNLTFEELLEKDKSFTIHEKNLQRLAIDMYKVKYSLCPKPFQELFTPSRGKNEWVLPKVKKVNTGLETIRYRGPKTWELVPTHIRLSPTLKSFKTKIKDWKPVGCKCRLCKTYVQGVHYIS